MHIVKQLAAKEPDIFLKSSCFLYYVFRQTEHMKKRNGGKAVNQQYLFHGTDHSLIEAICEQNFDWRMCGVHGTAYGKGTVKQFQQLNIIELVLFLKFTFVCSRK